MAASALACPQALRQIAAARLDASQEAAVWRRAHALRQHELIWAVRHIFVTQTMYDKAVNAGPEIDAALRWTREAGDPLADQIAAARATLLSDLLGSCARRRPSCNRCSKRHRRTQTRTPRRCGRTVGR